MGRLFAQEMEVERQAHLAFAQMMKDPPPELAAMLDAARNPSGSQRPALRQETQLRAPASAPPPLPESADANSVFATSTARVARPSPEPPPPSPPSDNKGSAWPWMAAAFLLTVGGGLLGVSLWRQGPDVPLPPPEPVVQAPPPPAAPVVEAAVAGPLTVETDPSGAEVWLDGSVVQGSTPLTLEKLLPGAHAVEVRKEGMKSAQERVTLVAAVGHSLKLVLTPQPPPPDAAVPAPRVEPTPPPVAHKAPPHKASPSRAPRRNADDDDDRPAVASNTPGHLTLSSRPWAVVYVDGNNTGVFTPVVDMELSPGRHSIKLVNNEEHMSASFLVEVQPGEELNISKDLK
jgi:serine/threonine-protein kinase